MKHLLLMFASTILLLTNAFAQAQIPNADFENWINYGQYEEPDGWNTLNPYTYLGGSVSATKATSPSEVYSGNYALKLETKANASIGIAVGFATTGTINVNTAEIEGGVPFDKRPVGFGSYFKYNPVGNDEAILKAFLFKWNSSTNTRDTIAEAELTTPFSTGNSFSTFAASFVYNSTEYPDTMLMFMSSSGSNPQIGSVLIVDDMHLFLCTGFSSYITTTDATTVGGNEGSATVFAVAGVAPYEYLWSTGETTETISNLSVGLHCVTITDGNDCITSSCGIVSGPECANFSAEVVTTDITYVGVNNGTAQAIISGGMPPYNYSWNNGVINAPLSSLAPGEYCLGAFDDNNCVVIACGTVEGINCWMFEIAANVTNATSQTSSDGEATVFPTNLYTDPINYIWSNGADGETVTNLVPGVYEVTATDGVGCTATAVVEVSFSVNVNDIKDVQEVLVFPNPAENIVSIKCNSCNDTFFVLNDLAGKQVLSKKLNSATNNIELSDVVKGIYLYAIKDASHNNIGYGKLFVK